MFDPRYGQGERQDNLMWTQWKHEDPNGERDEWGRDEWKGCNVVGIGKQDHTTKIRISHKVPFLKLKVNKGDPTRLGYKGNHEIGN